MKNKHVAIIGASSDPKRFSHQAQVSLKDNGYNCFLVNPNQKKIDGFKVYSSFEHIPSDIDTITVYISPSKQSSLFEDIKNKGCRRVIFNPGTENPHLASQLKELGVEVVNACTLVMLQSGSFE